MRWGTSYFVSLDAAIRYYRPYFTGTRRDLARYVQTKVDTGEIHIGKPHVLDGGKLLVIDNGTRYAIEVQEAPVKGARTGSASNARALGDEEVGRG